MDKNAKSAETPIEEVGANPENNPENNHGNDIGKDHGNDIGNPDFSVSPDHSGEEEETSESVAEELSATTSEVGAEGTPQSSHDEIAEGACETPAEVNIEQQLAEAEMRGYIRGRNERIEQLMGEPSIFESRKPQSVPTEASAEVMILANMRRSVWE